MALIRKLVLSATVALSAVSGVFAADLTGGVMYAVPVPNGKPPVIDGNLGDWDLSAAEPLWVSTQKVKSQSASVALMYDNDALYISAAVKMSPRLIHNPNNPTDAYWNGDVLEFRIATDPDLPYPLNQSQTVKDSDRVAHVTFWKNSDTLKDYVGIVYGQHLDKGHLFSPPGSKTVISETEGSYVLESRIPWAALNAPGGHNPFAPGKRMTAIWGVIWAGEGRTAALYRVNPGDFAFSQSGSWGQVEFAPTGHLATRHMTIEQATQPVVTTPVGVSLTIDLPKASKVSVNILGDHGEVIRELMGGEAHDKGPLTVYWDGRDQGGSPVAPGKYRWGAYLSGGVEAKYVGSFGISGTPTYETADNKGGWIGDHSELIDVASDATGVYILCPCAEAQRSIIKVGTDDKTVWRKTPWIGGGWGPLYAIATNGKYVFLTFQAKKPMLARLDAATGQLLTFDALGDGVTLMPVSETDEATVSPASSPIGEQPESSGLAATAKEVFVPVYSANIIQVFDAETGTKTRQMACASPRGVAVDAAGNLYAVSFGENGASTIVKFAGAKGSGTPVVTSGLVDPWHVAVGGDGKLYVTQNGASQQVAVFSASGKRQALIGKAGGRSWTGTYYSDTLLRPAGLAIDAQNRLVVVQGAIPKVVSRYDTANLRLLDQWYGAGAYWNADVPDPDNPLTGYYPFEPYGFGRATIDPATGLGKPNASWDLIQAGYGKTSDLYQHIASPEVKYLANGRKYMYSDTTHVVCVFDGDELLPVGSITTTGVRDKGNTTGKSYLTVWSDTNGNHVQDPGETTQVDAIEGQPVPQFAGGTGSMWIADNGDAYLITHINRILRVPVAGFDKSGAIRWITSAATWAASGIVPVCEDSLSTGWRQGLLGVRLDKDGNMYTCYNTRTQGLTPKLTDKLTARYPTVSRYNWQAYATPELAKQMEEGIGHTAGFNTVKFVKLDKNGNILWSAGRKATAAAGPGEMYHFWVLAGLIGNDYIAGGSEWGQMYIYTKDGYFVDALFNNPGLSPPPGPYTFGSETSGGRIQYFAKQGEVWAYCTGMAYRVAGFDATGHIVGEQRLGGTIDLDKVYDTPTRATVTDKALSIVRLAADPSTDASGWRDATPVTASRNGAVIATAKLGADATTLYAQIHVADDTPLQNSADGVNMAFKGGDAVGIDLGPDRDESAPGAGDVRILAAMVGGKPRLIAMKPSTSGAKAPQEYYTPAGGTKRFDFVGEIPGGKVSLVADPDGKGYTATFAVPLTFLDFPLTPTLRGDVEVLLSGQGARGLQTTSRNWYFTPLTASTTMVDDVPTESWLYPQYWGKVSVK